jgi:NTE family protein
MAQADGEAMRRVLVLQGGGALGAYQAGVHEALLEHGVQPEWIAGISIGAINAALIAGNPPDRQVDRLREFWTQASGGPQVDFGLAVGPARALTSQLNAAGAMLFGVGGFFTPRVPPPQFQPAGTKAALSYYDTAPLKSTLERLVDFDRINAGETRLSIGAVNIRTGNFAYFDNRREAIRPEHIMASGALPPGLPPIEIDGEAYWDGGLVSNTPLEYVLEEAAGAALLVFQVDLFPARGPMPRTLAEAAEREMDIRYSSRTRLITDEGLRRRHTKRLIRDLLDSLPPELAASEAAARLAELASDNPLTIVQLIYRRKAYETSAKDYEFSRATMLQHWASGVHAVRRCMLDRAAIVSPDPDEIARSIDVDAPGDAPGKETPK